MRIDDIVVEDVTGVFHRKLMDWVDVRDYGAVGDGVTDDAAAFEAADAAAAGRGVLVSAGAYFPRLERDLREPRPVRGDGDDAGHRRGWPARGTLTSTPTRRPSGPRVGGVPQALQALFYFTDHVTLDLCGRRIDLTEPVDVAAVAELTTSCAAARCAHGQSTSSRGRAGPRRPSRSVGDLFGRAAALS